MLLLLCQKGQEGGAGLGPENTALGRDCHVAADGLAQEICQPAETW